MIVVGLTGGIGAGKSTVASMLASRGAYIVDADQIARDLQAPGSPVLDAMADRFGRHIIRPDGALDRAAVAAIVFDDANARADLNAIVHPLVEAEMQRQISAHAGTDHVVVLDIPLLGERPRSGLAATIVVDVPIDEAIDRLVAQRGMGEADARARIASQVSRQQRLSIATHVIDNSGDRAALEQQVEVLWDELAARASDREPPAGSRSAAERHGDG